MEDFLTNQDELPFKRGKRAKYAPRACSQCQKRKIKCDGAIPCSPCVTRKRACFPASKTGSSVAGKGMSHTRPLTSPSAPNRITLEERGAAAPSQTVANASSTSTSELLNRIVSLEQRLASSAPPNSLGNPLNDETDRTPAHSIETATADRESPGPSPFAENSDRQTFVGEASMHALRDTDLQLEDASDSCPDSPISNGRPLTPKLHGTLVAAAEKKSRSWLRAILLSYGITPERSLYDGLMRTFFDEIHILYPFIHPPTVWQSYEYLWQRSLLISSDDLEDGEESKASVAIVFICLALGRCTDSTRAERVDGSHSAGWSLYSVATDLLYPILDLRFHSTPSLHSLQALALMVIYLFRLDATEKAGHILLNAVSAAHCLDLHRKSSFVNTYIYVDEMFTRVWWCLYLLDRRVSLETGRPFVIQDMNNERRLPFNVGDEWLQRHRSTRKTAAEMQTQISAEISSGGRPVSPYWEAMISTSRIVGDLWRVMYNDEQTNQGSSGIVRDYLDILLEDSRRRLPSYLRFRPGIPYMEQFAGQEWWQIKQCLFIDLRYSFLKLLIQRIVAKSSSNPIEVMTHDSLCAQLASACIGVVDNIPAEYPKYSFTFAHYVISASMILLSIVVKDPKFKDNYRDSIITAARILSVYCRKTWVSGKMIRTVSELNRLARHLSHHQVARQPDEMHSQGDRGQQGGSEGRDPAVLGDSVAVLPDQPSSVQPRHPGMRGPRSNARHPGVAEQDTYYTTTGISNSASETNMCLQKQRPEFSSNFVTAAAGSTENMATMGRFQNRQSSKQATQQEQQMAVPLTSHGFGQQGSSAPAWSSLSSLGTFADLPSWAMSDFEFEQAFTGATSGGTIAFGSLELSELDQGMAESSTRAYH